jgi:hypothetical protein
VINMSTIAFDVGQTGRGGGGEMDDHTGYISPRRNEILDHNIVYEMNYMLVLGSVGAIRSAAMAERPRDARPAYVFRSNRQGWTYVNARDAGWPAHGHLAITATGDHPQMIGPDLAFPANRAPSLYITAAFKGSGKAQLFWTTDSAPQFSEKNSIKFDVTSDGTLHTTRIPTASHPGWNGLITQLRFDPPGAAGAHVDVCSISWRPLRC